MSEFKQRVLQIVKKIPYGNVMSYGQIATYAGAPRGARQVGWILNQTEGSLDLPWWRVVNNAGRISIKGAGMNTPQLMKKLLESEGVSIREDFTFDIELYRYRASESDLKKWRLSEQYIEKIHSKYLRFS